ncbi:uncharacterized protein LOC100901015 [Galendromus occidentalis]|uniref:Uncharacterized protein LOC100901015 n=1 Tax=Galendromus occidentalis TaxID=34638 RepID=A0AAJ6QQS7_9ACAR|nr:uncharacterized protein LOC100901015 [Galendromus occidentalis]
MTEESGERATGMIKKLFFKKPEPFGFLKLLTPMTMRGEEAVFYLKDMDLKPFEKKLLHPGMQMRFSIREKSDDFMQSFVPFRAERLEPVDPAEYTASVIRSADPQPGGQGCLVCLDITLMRVSISPDSLDSLHLQTPLMPGDNCIVRITWREQLDAALQGKIPVGEIVSLTKPQLPAVPRQRSASVGEEVLAKTSVRASPEMPSDDREELSQSSDSATSEEETNNIHPGIATMTKRSKSMESIPLRNPCQSARERLCYDTPTFPQGMCCSCRGGGHTFPFVPMTPMMRPDEASCFCPMNPPIYHGQMDPSHLATNQMRCLAATPNSAQYPHAAMGPSAMGSGMWLPSLCDNPRQGSQLKMTLQEFFKRGGRIF